MAYKRDQRTWKRILKGEEKREVRENTRKEV